MSWLVKLRVPGSESEEVSWRLWDAGTTGVAEIGHPGDITELVAGFDDEAVARSTVAVLDRPHRRLVVERAGSWPTPQPTTVALDGLRFSIDPGRAFGHGRHPTTRLALDMVSTRALEGRSLLDVGTGTGVLAIAAALLGASPVVAVDNDPEAIEVAGRNAGANGVAVEICDRALSGLGATFEIVVANLLAADLAVVADELVRLVADGGQLLLAGFLADQVGEVQRLFPDHRPVEQHRRGPWTGLVMG